MSQLATFDVKAKDNPIFRQYCMQYSVASRDADGIEQWSFTRKKTRIELFYNSSKKQYVVYNMTFDKKIYQDELNEAIKYFLNEIFNTAYAYDDAWINRERQAEILAKQIAFELSEMRAEHRDVFYSDIDRAVSANFRSKSPIQKAIKKATYHKTVDILKNVYQMYVHS